MEIKTLNLEGYVIFYDSDVFLEVKPKDEGYYYPNVKSVGEIIADHFMEISKPVTVSYENWLRGDYVGYKDVFCRYYVSNKKITWDKAVETQIKKLAGVLDTEKRFDGYSEYTITDSWTELFVGGHDLRKELKSYKGKYVLIRIDYKL